MASPQASKIDKANHLLLDQPLLRLPYELLRNNFRSAHFTVEKESVAVKNALREAATAGLNGRLSTEDVLRSLDAMVVRMRGVKRKLETGAAEEDRLYSQVDARTAHLAELTDIHSLDDVAYEAWSRRRLDRLLVDYLLRHGYAASAEGLVEGVGGIGTRGAEDDGSKGTKSISTTTSEVPKSAKYTGNLRDLVDMDTFANMRRIRMRLLRDHSVIEALAWCADNKKELRKMESRLEFMLRYQQYIELARTQEPARLADAVAHARRHLSPWHTIFPAECRQAAALLCYPPAEPPAEYAELWSLERWAVLADLFTTTHYQLLALPSVPLLHLALSSGLSALKTPACHSSSPAGATLPVDLLDADDGDDDRGHDHRQETPTPTFSPSTTQVGASVCPICSPELNELARYVPYAHHSKSHAEQDTMMLPNGRVYSLARLHEYARKSGLAPGIIKDLRTGDIYPVDQLVKVFIF
ncbi:negative regulation of gluconeogenesis protein [Grosmannia clavigera kw1407]|uniref:Negative regulation of gluconeogenesis protein n=1 Tax=Grosmannia clavigera (strain kw1407 / UAMH 11150) TaxID=655863 RepID=F0XSF6_GROCL|nr:negative regulation of gluconeogenesis protein [Grosmannia clavigera kw1407]EFW99124.1 negative regulation of gluconeogenesis protein [Grosmannia clavigera kw1407]